MPAMQAFVGTELKFAFTITAEGFNMNTNDFTIMLMNGRKTKTILKEDCFQDENEDWFFVFDSTELGAGVVSAVFTAFVPDTDFDDEYRTEVAKIDLVFIKPIIEKRR